MILKTLHPVLDSLATDFLALFEVLCEDAKRRDRPTVHITDLAGTTKNLLAIAPLRIISCTLGVN